MQILPEYRSNGFICRTFVTKYLINETSYKAMERLKKPNINMIFTYFTAKLDITQTAITTCLVSYGGLVTGYYTDSYYNLSSVIWWLGH